VRFLICVPKLFFDYVSYADLFRLSNEIQALVAWSSGFCHRGDWSYGP
jgi:hypothetical protein